jgi:hypothetical protein
MKFNSTEQETNANAMFKRLALYMEEINATPSIDTAEATRQELNTYLLRLYCNLLNTADEIHTIRKQINK